ncbi:thyroid receptor-interacting protein 6-like [Crassostrea angulata]|uniref:thyroid receptor-interacting protein 6-like n=1 Tax=Magallana angulata TaxID=2784310 RepID=UPI0022B0FA40|nr:thyroid receptor-interacting protein 6-like [Crassostrea angulata]XP_052712880.1 thyroid receptor-interacting protein 6-like [Crassostrea angulata]
MTQHGIERSFQGLNMNDSPGTQKKIPPAVAPKPSKVLNTSPKPFKAGGGTYRQFRAEQGDEDFPPPPPQSSYIEEVAYPIPQVEQSRAYGYNDPQEDFPPPPSPTSNYNTHSPENVQYGVHNQMYSSYGDSPHNRSFEQYHTSSTHYQVDNHQPTYKGGRSMSPTGPPATSYQSPSNYANLQSLQSAYSSSGPSPQTDNTIYARPVKVVREPPDSYNSPRDTVTSPVGYVRQNIPDHRQYNNQENLDFDYSRSPSSGSGGFVPRYEDEYRGERPMPGPQVPSVGPESPRGGDKANKEAEVDALTSLLIQNMESSSETDFFGICVKCQKKVVGENNGCTANDQVYHISCFICVNCGTLLRGKSFYSMDNKPYCEQCYVSTLEKCSVCSKAITDRLLRATGKPYHPACFTCVVCGKSLDGIPFTVDATNQIHCIEDFHKKFAPRCCVCQHPIMPETGQEETVRVVAMDKSFHVQCYRCEDCGLLLSSEAEGRGCYPLDEHILCKNCNAKRIQAMSSKMATEL